MMQSERSMFRGWLKLAEVGSGLLRIASSQPKPTQTNLSQPKWTGHWSLVTAVYCLLLTAHCSLPSFAQSETLAIRAQKIITISGADVANGVVLVRDGKIAAVGQNVAIPPGAKVMEANVVMPGMVEAHTARGMDSPNENVPVVPFVSTADGLDPLHFTFEDALRDGITIIHVIQGNNTVIGGTGVIMKPFGKTIDDVIIKRPTAMKISLAPSGGRNRMAQMQELRRAFDDFDNYIEQLAERRAEQKKKGEPEEELDPKQAAMVDLKEGKLPAFIYCPRAADVPKAIELIESRKLKAVLVLGPDCYKAASLIAQWERHGVRSLQGDGRERTPRRSLPVVLDSQLIIYETDEDTGKEIMHVVPAEFYKAGVKFAFQISTTTYGSRYLWYHAATAVKHGVPRADALRAITLTAAEIIGFADRVGSLEVGKDANLLLLTGDPLDVKTWVDTVLIEGKVAYERKNDARLQKLLTGKGEN